MPEPDGSDPAAAGPAARAAGLLRRNPGRAALVLACLALVVAAALAAAVVATIAVPGDGGHASAVIGPVVKGGLVVLALDALAILVLAILALHRGRQRVPAAVALAALAGTAWLLFRFPISLPFPHRIVPS
ncbi:hypothetical protein [Coralloluteibacterium thermophilus]|uniref:Uncharacterized protein n=1 Tax=Coralloluteibacterium thermophilum TaxID=2707049 RepID=A0ABV9NNL3_9GAMM